MWLDWTHRSSWCGRLDWRRRFSQRVSTWKRKHRVANWIFRMGGRPLPQLRISGSPSAEPRASFCFFSLFTCTHNRSTLPCFLSRLYLRSTSLYLNLLPRAQLSPLTPIFVTNLQQSTDLEPKQSWALNISTSNIIRRIPRFNFPIGFHSVLFGANRQEAYKSPSAKIGSKSIRINTIRPCLTYSIPTLPTPFSPFAFPF